MKESSLVRRGLRVPDRIFTVLALSVLMAWTGWPSSILAADPASGSVSLSHARIIEPPKQVPTGDEIAINFEGVDLMSLLQYLSKETGKGFIIDEGVRGTITIISPVKLTRSEALSTLESILQVKGFAAIPSGRMYKIVSMAQAKVAGTETRRGRELSSLANDDTLVTQIIPLARTPVDEAKTILAPLLPQDAAIMTFLPSNTLIVTGRSVNIKRALEVLQELETGRIEGGLDIVPLQYTNAGHIKGQVDQILKEGGMGQDRPKGNVVIIPDSRTNALLVLTAPANFAALRQLITRLDTTSSDTRPEIQKFFPLKFADESEAVKQIQEILSLSKRNEGEVVATETVAIEATRLLPIKRTKSILVITRSPEILERIAQLLKELDCRPPLDTSNVQIVRIANADAKIMAETLSRLAVDKAKGKKDTTVKADEISFSADQHTNSLIVTGSPQVFAQYEAIIKALDIMRPQVLVEVLITEVSGNLSKSLGIEWGYIDPDKTHARAFGNTNFGLDSQALTGSGMQIGLVKGPLDLAKVINSDIGELSKIKAIMRVYQNNSEFNILSAPQLLTTDNEEAKIVVGEVVALPQGFTKDRDSGRFDLTNFKYEDVGITLAITPRVNSADLVTLKLNQEVKKRQEENLYEFSVPVLTKRQMETTITVPHQETIAIGGLMREDKTVVEDRIPFLSNLPLIGQAFRNKRRSVQKTNLMIFLTPHILSTPEEVARFDLSRIRAGRSGSVSGSGTRVVGKTPAVAKPSVAVGSRAAPTLNPALEKKRQDFQSRAKAAFRRFQTTLPATRKATGKGG